MCGLMSVNGDLASGPTRVGVPIVDHVTGYTALTGILLALYDRERTGLGQRIEATLFDTGLSLLVPQASNWLQSGVSPELLGSAHPNIAPYDKFGCLDGEIFLGILNDRQFRRFCEYLGLSALPTDVRFATNAMRLQNRDALRAEIETALALLSRDGLCKDLMRQGVPAGPVNTVPEALQQAHAEHRGMRVEHGSYRGLGLPVRLSRTPGCPGEAPPRFGRHSDQVLTEIGLSEDQIADLHARGVVPEEPRR
jgi:crotonobetainyl-CoA:carnitine CoA-transferase CaiB-like acyl-CoA transferase